MGDVLHNLWLVEKESAKIGLQLNHHKSELCEDPTIRDNLDAGGKLLACRL